MSKKEYQNIVDYVLKTPANTNPQILSDMVDELAGAKLPEVTDEDNGKVLGVVEGKWDKMEGGSGASVMVVTFTQTGGSSASRTFSADKTFEELDAFFKNGGAVLGRWIDDGGFIFPMYLAGGSGTYMGEYEFVMDNDHYREDSSTMGGWYRFVLKYSSHGIDFVDGYVELA